MGLRQRAFRWRDERLAIVELRRQAEATDLSYKPQIEAARQISREAWAEASAARHHEMMIILGQIEQIETKRRLQSAYAYGVPVPSKPSMDDESEYWDWYSEMGDHYLSVRGHALLRREIAMERDLYYKPWLSWIAIIISVTGLAISAFTALLT